MSVNSFFSKLVGTYQDEPLEITENGDVDVSEYDKVHVEVEVKSDVELVPANAKECKLFAYVINGIAYVRAHQVYVGGNTSGLNIVLPTALDDEAYVDKFGCHLKYSAVAAVGLRKAPDVISIGTVTIIGGTNYIVVDRPGYYTFELSYPISN